MNGFRDNIRQLKYSLYGAGSKKHISPAEDVVIDVMIPVLEKDFKILPLCVEGIRTNVNHRIDRIYVVSPPSERIESFCRDNDIIFLNENTLLEYSPDKVNFITAEGINRSGWIFQQLIKLSGVIGENRYTLVIDADHVLLNPHTFIASDGRLVFYRSSAHHVPYYTNMASLTGLNFGYFTFSYITYKMIFDKEILASLRNMIEQRTGKKWDEAILESLDKDEASPFSEFELYGNFVPDKKKVSLQWKGRYMSYDSLDTYENLQQKYGKRHMSLTFPNLTAE